MLFKSFRKSFNFALILICSYGIHISFLFNYNENNEWFEVFKCLDGSLSPKSIGIKNKKILRKMLILTKFMFKLSMFVNLGFFCIVTCIALVLIFEKSFVYGHFEILWLIPWISITLFKGYFFSGLILTASSCFVLICLCCLINAKYYNLMINQFGSESLFVSKWKFKCFKQQNQFAIRIQKYNKFWRKFYLIMMFYLIPSHMIYLQQILFGEINFDDNLINICACFFATIFIMVSCSIVCLLHKQIKLYTKKLIQLQFIRCFDK